MAERDRGFEGEPNGFPLPDFKYIHNAQSDTLDIILHGLKVGMDSRLITKVADESKKQGYSVAAFNFPYFSRGDRNTSSQSLEEEIAALRSVLEFVHYEKFEKVRLIGKSLGGIVAGEFLKQLQQEEAHKFEAIILGYDTGGIDLKTFPGDIKIIQGSRDKHGSVEVVRRDLEGAAARRISYHSIDGGDHSYRGADDNDETLENLAVEAIYT